MTDDLQGEEGGVSAQTEPVTGQSGVVPGPSPDPTPTVEGLEALCRAEADVYEREGVNGAPNLLRQAADALAALRERNQEFRARINSQAQIIRDMREITKDFEDIARGVQTDLDALRQAARPVLEFVSKGRNHMRQYWHIAPDARARQALALLDEAPRKDQG